MVHNFLVFRPKKSALADIYKTIGMDYDERILPSIANEVLKSVIAKFDAAELITQRTRVSQKITQELEERAEKFNILMASFFKNLSKITRLFNAFWKQAVYR